ncbi:MAG: hypothetical protein ACYCSQ_01240 [bacterium]
MMHITSGLLHISTTLPPILLVLDNGVNFTIFIIISIVAGLILTSVGHSILECFIETPIYVKNRDKGRIPMEYINFREDCDSNNDYNEDDKKDNNNILYADDIVNALKTGGFAGELSEVYFATYNVFVGLGTIALIGFFYDLRIMLGACLFCGSFIITMIILAVCCLIFFIGKCCDDIIFKFFLVIVGIILFMYIFLINKSLTQSSLTSHNYSILIFDALLTIFLFNRGVCYYKKFANQINKAISNNR